MADNQTESRQLADLQWELAHDCRLPDASGFGLEVLPGTPCYPLDTQERKDFIAKAAALEGKVDPAALAASKANLEVGLQARSYAAGAGPEDPDPVQNALDIQHWTDGTYHTPEANAFREGKIAQLKAATADWTGPTIDTVAPLG